MCELSSVQFDKMEVNTGLAVDYFKQKNNVFKSKTELTVQDLSQDSDGHNTIYLASSEQAIETYIKFKVLPIDIRNAVHHKLFKLAKLVEKNAELFCQIEHAIRKLPLDEVKNYDIQLIMENLTSRSYVTYQNYLENFPIVGIKMNSNSPLSNLGFVAQLLMRQDKALIFATKETAAACYLFLELCQAAGLETVELLFIGQDSKLVNNRIFYDMADTPAIISGCIGVITEHSDLDSAVDVLLRTTTNYPWKLTRIYVQESIYDKFKKVMAWKSNLKSETTDELNDLKQMCDNVFVRDNKIFLVDYTGAPNSANDKILVEAYRTTKELITLVTKHDALYMSVWSSDISEANEIAYKVPSSIVWLNSYGIFDGPPNASQAIYKELLMKMGRYVPIDKKYLLALHTKWSQKSFEERRSAIYNAISEYLEKNIDASPLWQETKELFNVFKELETEDFVYAQNSRICTSLSVPCNIVLVEKDIEWYAPHVAKLLTSGAALVYSKNNKYFNHIQQLCADIPITSIGSDTDRTTRTTFDSFACRTKIIWTNFGTIFAN